MAGPWNGPGRRSIALRLWDSYPLSADLIGHRLPPIVPTDPLLARRFLHRVFQTIPRGRGRFGRLRVVGSTTWKSSTFQGHGLDGTWCRFQAIFSRIFIQDLDLTRLDEGDDSKAFIFSELYFDILRFLI